ncbi:unnamed protein product [Somion occarium]|uniref:Uncharacterized protein n=1 Tax=Somion occarium TaxID=3059160 RepID=A0ABP1E906_9APHY
MTPLSFFKSFYEWMSKPDPGSRPPYDPFDEEGQANIVIPIALNNAVVLANVSANCGRKRRELPIPLKEIWNDSSMHSRRGSRFSSTDRPTREPRGAVASTLTSSVCESVGIDGVPVPPLSLMTNSPTEILPSDTVQTPSGEQNIVCAPRVL